MAENLHKKPAKGILKSPSSLDETEANKNNAVDIKWDEMNILQTLHPPDKDYGHMKIEEPKTPYSYYEDDRPEQEISGHGSDTLDADLLAKKINICSDKNEKPTVLESSIDDDDEEEEEEETEEEKAVRSAFEYKRKMHYNEFYAVKLARKLIDKNDDKTDDDDEEKDD